MTNEQQSVVDNPPPGWPRIVPHLIYDDVGGAIEWLSRAFGFRERTAARHILPNGTVGRCQMEVVDSLVTLGPPSVHGGSPKPGGSTMVHVYVDNVDEHYARARAASARIVLELEDRPWADRSYQVTDLEGHEWTFAQHCRDVEPHEATPPPRYAARTASLASRAPAVSS